jgi:hypothetical protein
MKYSLVLLFAGAAALRPSLRGIRKSVFYATSTRKRTQKPKAPPQTKDMEIPIYTASPTTEHVPPHLVNAAMYEAEMEEEEAARAKDNLCRTMFARFARGQELLRRNHGAPVLHGPDTLDLFVGDLAAGGVAPDVIELLQRMREGAFLNGAGGTQGGRLQLSLACLNKEEEFQTHVKEAFFRDGDVHFELFPSTTKSIESFCSLLAAEASLRERPIKILLPADAHYAWTNVLAQYEAHPYFKSIDLAPGDDFQVLRETRFRPGDLVVGVYTLANTVSGRATPVEWFQDVLAYCEGEGASTAYFVDAALAGLCVAKDTLDLRADEDVAEILDGAVGLVQSGFKDFGLSSMLFLDDAEFECCGRRDESGLQSAVAGGAHALIKHAPVTSIPESPTLAFLLYAREYTAFRKSSFVELCAKLRKAIPEDVDYELRPLFPLLHLEFHDADVTAALTDALMATYSLITIDAEPNVVRLWPTPTNHDVADAIAAFFD